MEKTLIIKLVISILYGIAAGLLTIPLSKKLTLSRTDDPSVAAVIEKPLTVAVVVLISLASSIAISLTVDETGLMIRNLVLLFPMLSIMVVDMVVRKIPNPLLLTMIITELAYILYYCISEKTADIIPKVIIGIAVGLLLTWIPGLLKIPIGNGDIKYCAVIGACVYIMGFAQAMVTMSLLVGIVYIVLKITKKGDMKTMLPMGPFLSVGTIVTMCIPIANANFGNLI